jgi:hypothetical protein
VQLDHVEPAEPMVGGVKGGVLTRQNQRRAYASSGKRMRNRSELDGFWSGPDDQPDVGKLQRSPYFGRSNLIPLWIKCKQEAR